jgi:hypothetical protein
MRMERLKPDPVPRLRPLPELRAEGEVKALYDDTKRVLQVPWMGVVTMAYAHYLPFYRTLWRGLSPIFESRALVDACADLRRTIEGQVAALDPPPIVHRLDKLGYAPREIDQIREMVEVFSHGNFLYAVLATLTRLAMEGQSLPPQRDAERFVGRHAPDVSVPLVLMEAHHVDAPTRSLYDEIESTLGLPFVNTDYRALARWPSYFHLAWADLGPVIADPRYEPTVRSLHEALVECALALPNPGGLSAAEIRDAASDSAPFDEVLAVCRLFQWLLPGLITNVAFFRHQLGAR